MLNGFQKVFFLFYFSLKLQNNLLQTKTNIDEQIALLHSGHLPLLDKKCFNNERCSLYLIGWQK